MVCFPKALWCHPHDVVCRDHWNFFSSQLRKANLKKENGKYEVTQQDIKLSEFWNSVWRSGGASADLGSCPFQALRQKESKRQNWTQKDWVGKGVGTKGMITDENYGAGHPLGRRFEQKLNLFVLNILHQKQKRNQKSFNFENTFLFKFCTITITYIASRHILILVPSRLRSPASLLVAQNTPALQTRAQKHFTSIPAIQLQERIKG